MINYIKFKKGDKLEVSWDQLSRKDMRVLRGFPKVKKKRPTRKEASRYIYKNFGDVIRKLSNE